MSKRVMIIFLTLLAIGAGIVMYRMYKGADIYMSAFIVIILTLNFIFGIIIYKTTKL